MTRLKDLRNGKGESQTDLADIIGVSLRTVQNYESGSTDIPMKNLEKIAQHYNVSVSYLFQDNELHEAREPDGIWVKFESFKLVPLVNYRAQAGFLSGYGDDEYIEDLPKIPWEVDREYKGRYITFEVSGDSMESDENPRESIFEDDLLLCREIQRQHWKNKLHINKWDFVIAHRSQGILVKRITEHNVQNGDLKLHSLNPYYEDQVVNMDDLIAIFNIVDIKRKRKRR